MKRFSLVLFVLFSSFGLAQSPLGFLDRLINLEEHLIHREEIGPYLLSADGVRLLENPYLKLDIRYEGKPIPADSKVLASSTLFQWGDNVQTTYTPVHDGETFIIEPLELDSAKEWSWDQSGWLRMDVTIDGPAGLASGDFGFSIFPDKPEVGLGFRALNFAIPFMVLALFAGVFGLTKVRLRQPVKM